MNSLLINRKVYTIKPKFVRNGILDVVRKQMTGTQFASRLIAHLEKIGKAAFDKYNDFEIALKEYNVVLRFQTGELEGEAMTYTIDNLDFEPNIAFKRKWTDVFRF
jgi:hypothetical protein